MAPGHHVGYRYAAALLGLYLSVSLTLNGLHGPS